MEIDHYLQVIRRWVWLIVYMTIAAAAISFFLVQRQTPTYVAQAKLLVGPGINSPVTDSNTGRSSAQFMQTYADLATTRSVLQQVIDDLQLNMSPTTLAGQITVAPALETQVLNITVRSHDQTRAIAVANGLANVLVGLDTKARGGSAGNSGGSASQIQEQRARVQARIDQLEAELEAANQAQNHPEIKAQEAKIQELEEQLAAPIDPAIAKRMQDRQARIAQLETSLKSTLSLEARRLILDELAREDSLLAADRALVDDRKSTLNDELNQERNRLTSMQPAILQRQNLLQSQLTFERNQLAALYSRQIEVIDPAVTATPEGSRSSMIVIVASLAGLVLGLTLAFAFEYLDDRVRTTEQLGKATGVPVWGSIGRQTVLLRPGRFGRALSSPTDWKIAEAFRWLCMKLTPDSPDGVCSVLVTSFEQGDTAAVVASNLAITLTRAGKRVALVDANLRRPTLGTLFQTEGQEGVADWLADGANDPKLVPIEWAPGLMVMPVGTVPGDMQELTWPRMQELLKRVMAQADMVVVTGPPLSGSADSFFLASQLGGVLAVAQNGETRRSRAAETVESLRSMGVQVLGLILADGVQVRFKALQRLAPGKNPERLALSGPRPVKSAESSKDKPLGPLATAAASRSGTIKVGPKEEAGSDKS